ncbi:MAG: hypothetical protein KDB94_01690 [Acidobacteria bacterium]|nr:hypothetical protein [Acidobacteriota bacterium]
MSDFNPSNALVRNAWEATEQYLPTTGFHCHDFVSESLSANYEQIQQRSITNAGQRPVASPSKIGNEGQIEVDWNAEGHLHYLANLQKNYSVSNPATGVYVTKMAPSEANAAPSTMMVEVWRDDDLAHVNKGCRVRSVTFNAGLRQFIQGSIDLLAARSDYWGAATQTAGTGSSLPQLRGLPNYTNWALADHDIYFTWTDYANKVGKFKIGAAASFGATTVTISGVDTWVEAIDSNGGARIGDRAMPVDILFDLLAAGADSDIFKITGARGVWTPTLPDVVPANEIYALIVVDGEEFVCNQFNLTVTRPVAPIYSIGGRYARVIRERGQRTVDGTLNREYISTELRKKLERAQEFEFYASYQNGVAIGSTAYESEIKLTAKKCVLSGPTPTVGGQDQMDENLNFSCHPSDDGTYPDDLTIEVTSTISDPTA